MADVVVPGGARTVRGTLDGSRSARGCVVACPPHPQAGGTRSNPVLTAVGSALAVRGVATLRFDYGPWANATGEVSDAVRAIEWAKASFPGVGAFGYSFGATIALGAAAETDVMGVSALSPAREVGDVDTIAALERVSAPVQLLYGERDRVVDSTPVADRARDLGHAVEGLPADHHFAGQRGKVAERVATFFERHLTSG